MLTIADKGGWGQKHVKQARKPRSYASPKLRLTDLLTGVKCRATSVAKNCHLDIAIFAIIAPLQFCDSFYLRHPFNSIQFYLGHPFNSVPAFTFLNKTLPHCHLPWPFNSVSAFTLLKVQAKAPYIRWWTINYLLRVLYQYHQYPQYIPSHLLSVTRNSGTLFITIHMGSIHPSRKFWYKGKLKLNVFTVQQYRVHNTVLSGSGTMINRNCHHKGKSKYERKVIAIFLFFHDLHFF